MLYSLDWLAADWWLARAVTGLATVALDWQLARASDIWAILAARLPVVEFTKLQYGRLFYEYVK